MANLTEERIDAELLANIEGAAAEAAMMLGISMEEPELKIVEAVDEFVFASQKGEQSGMTDDEDPALSLGSLWGQQLVRSLGWQWAAVQFRDADSKAVGVFSPDRSLAIYPFHFVYGCLENQAPVTILLSFNLLVDGSRIPPLPSAGYENVMDNVHHVVPRS